MNIVEFHLINSSYLWFTYLLVKNMRIKELLFSEKSLYSINLCDKLTDNTNEVLTSFNENKMSKLHIGDWI
jgi:hypothetical protein